MVTPAIRAIRAAIRNKEGELTADVCERLRHLARREAARAYRRGARA